MGKAGGVGPGAGKRRPERRRRPGSGAAPDGVAENTPLSAPVRSSGLSDTDRALLREGLSTLALPADHSVLEKLGRYLAELQLWSRRTDLVRFADTRELIVRHVLDSVAPAAILIDALRRRGIEPERARACDAGSGAGLPGVPLALCMPFQSVHLLERSASRVAFLQTVCAVVQRPGLSVIEGDLALPADRFDLVLVRALSPFDEAAVRGLARAVADAGVLALYQGKPETARAAARRLRSWFAAVDVLPVTVPYLGAERHMVVAHSVTGSSALRHEI